MRTQIASSADTLDPRTKLALALAALIGSLGASTWWGLAVTLAALVVWSATVRVPWSAVLRAMKAVRILLVFSILFHALLGTGAPLVALGPIVLTKTGLLKGLWMASRLVLMVVAATVLTTSTSPLHLTQGLDAASAPLQRLGVRTREFTMMFGISLRFLPVLADEAKRIQEAQLLRNPNTNNESAAARIRALVPVLVPLLGGALRRADELGIAMAARGYHPQSERTYLHPLHFTASDAIITTSALLFGIGIAVWL